MVIIKLMCNPELSFAAISLETEPMLRKPNTGNDDNGKKWRMDPGNSIQLYNL